MDRPIKEIITPIGKNKIIIKEWLTGGEAEQIEDIFLDDISVNVSDGKPQQSGNVKANKVRLATHKTIELTIISIDEKTDDILNRTLNLRDKDYQFILSEIDKTSELNKKKEK